MKYHSFQWWIQALWAQAKHLLRNVILRGIFKVQFAPTVPDGLTEFILENAQKLYDYLTKKYPEYQNLHKYVKLGLAFTSMELCAAGIFVMYRLPAVFWSYDSTIDDIKFLLTLGIACNAHVRLASGKPHSVTVVALNDETNEIIYNDPLGDPAFRHRLVFGYNVRSSFDRFLGICLGNPIRITFPGTSTPVIREIEVHYAPRNLYSLKQPLQAMR